MPTERSEPYTIQAVEKATAVLLASLTPPHSMGVSEASRRVGLNKNQTFRLLTTHEQSGLLMRDPDSAENRLSWRLVELGHVAASGISLRQVARPITSSLAAETAETIRLVAFDGVEAVGVER